MFRPKLGHIQAFTLRNHIEEEVPGAANLNSAS